MMTDKLKQVVGAISLLLGGLAVFVSALAFVWWVAFLSWFKSFQCAIPACAGCARQFMRQYRMRFVVETILVLAAIALAIYLIRDIPRPWQKWAGIGSALLILMPMRKTTKSPSISAVILSGIILLMIESPD